MAEAALQRRGDVVPRPGTDDQRGVAPWCQHERDSVAGGKLTQHRLVAGRNLR